MKLVSGKFIAAAGIFVLSSLLFLNPRIAFAASGHGCSTQEADRDGDGIADKNDAFPDDPSQHKEELLPETPNRFCGDQQVVMKLFFVPFQSRIGQSITPSSIESENTNALVFCAPNDVTETIQNILARNPGNSEESAAAQDPLSEKSADSLPALESPDAIEIEEEEDFDELFSPEPEADVLLDENQIRLKVQVPQTADEEITYLVDAFGNGTKDGENPFKLTAGQMSAIEKMVESVSGVVDLNLKALTQEEAWKSNAQEALMPSI